MRAVHFDWLIDWWYISPGSLLFPPPHSRSVLLYTALSGDLSERGIRVGGGGSWRLEATYGGGFGQTWGLKRLRVWCIKINLMRFSAEINLMKCSAKINLMRCGAKINLMKCSAKINLMRCSAKINLMRCSAKINLMRCSAKINLMKCSAKN